MSPKPYSELDLDEAEATRMVVRSAGNSLVLFSGGSKVGDDALIAKARIAMESGATGLIFGRNVWQRPYAEAMRISQTLLEMMSEYPAQPSLNVAFNASDDAGRTRIKKPLRNKLQ